MEYEELLELIGDFGPTQKYVIFYIFVVGFINAANVLDVIFALYVPEHTCDVTKFSANNTAGVTTGYNWTISDLKKYLIPIEEHEGASRYSQCSMYETNRSITYTPPGGDSNTTIAANVVSCSEWSYYKQQITSSLVVQWDLVCGRKWMVSLAYTISMAGFLFGVFFFGNLADRIGRRKAAIAAVVGYTVFRFVALFAPNFGVYVFAKFVVTSCNIGCFTIIYIISVEMVCASRRLLTSTMTMLSWDLSYFLLAGAAYIIKDAFYVQLAFTIASIPGVFLGWFLPESLRWLYAEGRLKDAHELTRKTAEKAGKLHLLPTDLKVHVQDEKNVHILHLFKTPKLRRYTLCLMFIWFSGNFVYYGLTMNSGFLSGDIYLNFFLGAVVDLAGNLVAPVMLKYAGRKKTMFLSLLIVGFVLLSSILVPTGYVAVMTSLTMVGKMVVTVTFTVNYIYTAELNPTVLRGVGLSVASAVSRVGGICAPNVAELGYIRKFIPVVVFGVVSLLAALLTIPLPETKDRALPNTIDDVENFDRKKQLNENVYDEDNIVQDLIETSKNEEKL